ncbi:MAG: adenosylcobinamide-GDP ribazoletransferase [Butyrivibrio sp.]|jgi:adenosylcobinamide-GDP ribazoletransferase|nr:adenosylcobinamide-GDP ribazoletransferase [Butyrivibrio sp.]
MSLFRSFIIAISMYSRIPVPQFEWKEKDMRYAICFFPIVGVVIGLVQYLLNLCLQKGFLAVWEYVILSAAAPLLITGGIHLDGFMDVSDALHSYAPAEKKLEIMKDPHIGAFAVISLLAPGLLWIGALIQLSLHMTKGIAAAMPFIYVLSRIFSGMALVWFPSAKKDGLLYTFASASHKKAVRTVLLLSAIFCHLLLLWISPAAGLLLLFFCLTFPAIYRAHAMRTFGGITGDTEGWFLCLEELFMLLLLAVLVRF